MTIKHPLRVILESPYAADTGEEVRANIAYAQLCMRDCFMRGWYPFAGHLLFTQDNVLDDTIPKERALGIAADLSWGSCADASVVYTDFGLSSGMNKGIEAAGKLNRPIYCYHFFNDNAENIVTLENKYAMLIDLWRAQPRKIAYCTCFSPSNTLKKKPDSKT